MKKILIVDDDIVMIRLFQVQMKRTSYEGYYFQESAQAAEQFKAIAPDLAVLDFNMPGMNGPELLARIREEPLTANIPVIFVTGEASRTSLNQVENLPNVEVLAKPFSPRRLITLIDELLKKTVGS